MDDVAELDWRAWCRAAAASGWLRPVDIAFADLLARHAPDTAPLVLLSAALTSAALAQGHVCLPLATALTDLATLLDPGRAAEEGTPVLPAKLTLTTWREALAVSAVVGRPTPDAPQDTSQNKAVTPLVLLDERLYLRRYWRYQEIVAAGIAARVTAELPLLPALPAMLDEYFGPLRDAAECERQSVHWQSVAGALAARRRFAVISGGPGTGKTTTVVRLLGLLQQLALDAGRPLRIRLAAPTGKAAARLTESIGAAVDQLPAVVRDTIPTAVVTLHRLLRPLPPTADTQGRRFRHGRDNPLHLDLLVVDEASMVDLELMAQLLDALPPTARLILLGDRDQLASVEAGAVLGELCRDAGQFDPATADWLFATTGYRVAAAERAGGIGAQVALLQKSHRFSADSGIGRLAAAVNAGSVRTAASCWAGAPHELQQCRPTTPESPAFKALVLDGSGEAAPDLFAATAGYRDYLTLLREQRPATAEADALAGWALAVLEAFGRFQLLAALRRGRWGVEGLNAAVASLLGADGLLTPAGDDGGEGWYEGRPVLVTRNDYALGLMNGDIGMTLAVPGAGLRVFFRDPANGGVRSVAAGRLGAVETAFVMTVHKSQGSEFDHAVLVLPERDSPLLTRELVYTAITRARSRFTLVAPAPEVWEAALQRRVVRASGLGDRLAELLGRG